MTTVLALLHLVQVVWNEFCLLFPDGSTVAFNEAVRYTALTGYLRKRPVVGDGRAEFALAHGESHRSWARHFFHLSLRQLAWFHEDPQVSAQRQLSAKHASRRCCNALRSLEKRVRNLAVAYKLEHSRGKEVGSAPLYTAPCRLYVSRLYRNEFALAFGGDQLVLMQAASGADALEWVVAIASCLFFTSPAFESVLIECQRFFDAAQKTVEGKLSPIEALDLVRMMGRPVTYSQVVRLLDAVYPESDWFGPREFTYLIRRVCQDVDPRSELLRAFRLLDYTQHANVKGQQTAVEGSMAVADLTRSMRAAGVSEDNVLMVTRAAGVETEENAIPYSRLADSLYPSARTSAKRRRVLLTSTNGLSSDDESAFEAAARREWDVQREEILRAARMASPSQPAPALRRSQRSTAALLSGASSAVIAKALADRSNPKIGGVRGGTAVPMVPALGLAKSVPKAGIAESAHDLTPRRQEITRSMITSTPVTPRTIADRVSRARRASAAAASKIIPPEQMGTPSKVARNSSASDEEDPADLCPDISPNSGTAGSSAPNTPDPGRDDRERV